MPPSPPPEERPPAPSTAMVQSNTPPSDGVVLDHRYFPHIIDRIWDFMAYPSIVVCTKVNQRWHDQADLRLRDHVAAFHYEGQPPVYRSRNVEYPEVSAPLYDNKFVVNSSHPDDIFEQMFYEASVYDAYSTCPLDAALAGPPSSWPHCFNRIYDLHGDDWREPEDDEEMTHYIDTVCSEELVCFLEYRDGHFFGSPSRARNVQSLTLSINCYDDPMQPSATCSADMPSTLLLSVLPDVEGVVEVFVILKDARQLRTSGSSATGACSCCPSSLRPGPFRQADSDTYQYGALSVLVLLAAFPNAGTTAVMGTESFVTGVQPKSLSDSALNSLAGVETYSGSFPCLEEPVRFLTLEEFRHIVGDDEYLLATVQ